MENKEITLHVKFSRRQLTALLALFFLSYHPGTIGSETLTLTTYYPAPYGGYVALLTTGGTNAAPMNTLLARDAGTVAIGTGANPPAALPVRMHVQGWTLIGQPGNTDRIQFETQGSFHRVSFNDLRFWDSDTGSDMVRFNNNQVGIGRAPSFPLDVEGPARINNGDLTVNNGDISLSNGHYIRNFCQRVRYLPSGSTNCPAGMRVVGFQGDGVPRIQGFLPATQTTTSVGNYIVVGEDWGGYMVCCRYI